MSYEEEQKKLSKEVAVLQLKYDALKAYFEEHPYAKKRQGGTMSWNIQRDMLEKQAQHYNMYDTYADSDEYLTFRLIAARLGECKYRLKQSKTQQAVSDGIKFIGSITPQHVSGRIYKVENGDGCGTFCLWFMIVDAIIVFIYYLISEGFK